MLNGLIFLGSIFFFDQAVIPVIHLFGEILQSSFAQGYAHAALCLRYDSSALTGLASCVRVCTSPGQAEDVRDRVDGFVFLLYQVLWMYPIYCISFILNTIWYQEIADDGARCARHSCWFSDAELATAHSLARLLLLCLCLCASILPTPRQAQPNARRRHDPVQPCSRLYQLVHD